MDRDHVFLFGGITAATVVVCTYVLWGPSPCNNSRKRGSVIGLQNLGLTCYLNSLLQALASCHFFVTWLNNQENKAEVADSMNDLLNVLSGRDDSFSSSTFVSPVEVVKALHNGGWKITNSQQDVHELLCNVVSILEEEAYKACLNLTVSVSAVTNNVDIIYRKPTTSIEGNSSRRNDVLHVNDRRKDRPVLNENGIQRKMNGNVNDSRGSFTNKQTRRSISYSRRSAHDLNQTPKPSPFRGYLANRIECTKCTYKSVVRYDKFDVISLHLPEITMAHNMHTLSELLDNYVKSEVISGVNCEGCNADRDPSNKTITSNAVKLLRIGKLPACLCFHIVRTSYHEYGVYKRQDYVDFPEYLFMDSYVYKPRKCNNFTIERNIRSNATSLNDGILHDNSLPDLRSSHIYRLKSVIVHRGSHNDGHFMTYRRGTASSDTQHRCSDTRWFLVSDTDVKETTLLNVLSSVAYVLFYERCHDFI